MFQWLISAKKRISRFFKENPVIRDAFIGAGVGLALIGAGDPEMCSALKKEMIRFYGKEDAALQPTIIDKRGNAMGSACSQLVHTKLDQ
jgi:hypothetical protein